MNNTIQFQDLLIPLKKLAKVPQARLGGVACFVVKNGAIISSGVNYNPTGASMEHVVDGVLVSRPEVIHAEVAAIRSAAENAVDLTDATLLITMSPCIKCANEIVKSNIAEVVYMYEWWDKATLDIFAKSGIKIQHIKDER